MFDSFAILALTSCLKSCVCVCVFVYECVCGVFLLSMQTPPSPVNCLEDLKAEFCFQLTLSLALNQQSNSLILFRQVCKFVFPIHKWEQALTSSWTLVFCQYTSLILVEMDSDSLLPSMRLYRAVAVGLRDQNKTQVEASVRYPYLSISVNPVIRNGKLTTCPRFLQAGCLQRDSHTMVVMTDGTLLALVSIMTAMHLGDATNTDRSSRDWRCPSRNLCGPED